MKDRFRIRIGFVEESSQDAKALVIGGIVVQGHIRNGSEGVVSLGNSEIPLRVIEVAFLERASADSIMFSVNKPTTFPNFETWVGSYFEGLCAEDHIARTV